MKISVVDLAHQVAVLPFAACYVYSPVGADRASRRSRRFCAAVKGAGAARIACSAALVRVLAAERPAFAQWFEPTAVLVPVPASVPSGSSAVWAAGEIAAALAHAGLGAGSQPILQRSTAVRKSATAPAGGRPTIAEHYESFAVTARADGSECFVLVDDVITRGRTLFAAACALRAAFPHATIRGFALLRTMGFAGVGRLVEPCIGEIRWRRGEVYRQP